LTPTSTPYTQYLNFDKPLVGFFILFFSGIFLASYEEWRNMFKKMLPFMLAGFAIILVSAFLLKFVTYDPKWTNYFFIWALVNLFFTATAEEGLCRGFLQRYSDVYFTSWKYGSYIRWN
jgi:membrane protease YdiL (CAAX protease family)